MNTRYPLLTSLFLFLMILPGCDLIEGVFKLGIWFTILGFILVIVLLVLIFSFTGEKQARKSTVASRQSDSG